MNGVEMCLCIQLGLIHYVNFLAWGEEVIETSMNVGFQYARKWKKYETYYRSARVQVWTISKYILTILNKFLALFYSISIFYYLGLSRCISVYLGLSKSILVYLGLSCSILFYLGLSWTILDYIRLSGNIWDYLGLFWTIWDDLRLSGTISD